MKKLYLALLILLFAILPLNALLTNVVNFKFDIALPVNAWKEGVVVLLTLIVGWHSISRKKWPHFTWLDYVLVAFFLLGIVSALFQTKDGGRILYGFKYDYEFLWLFLVVRHGIRLSEKEITKIVMVAITSGVIAVLFGFLQLTILPKDVMTLFGYAPLIGTWVPGGPLPMYHTIDPDGTIVRIASSLSGPNQYASYLLFLIPLLLWQTWRAINLQKTWWGIISTIAVLNLFVTYSRSAYIALLLSIIICGMLIVKNKQLLKKILLITFAFLVGISAVVTVIKPDIWHSLLIRTSSTQGHFERTRDGILYTLQNPLGYGLGNAGPASTRFNQDQIGWIPESWYLQISLELGILGLILFVTILISTLQALYQRWKQKNPWALPLFASLLAICFSSLFLHSWEESAVALSCWGLMGLVLYQKVEHLAQKQYNIS